MAISGKFYQNTDDNIASKLAQSQAKLKELELLLAEQRKKALQDDTDLRELNLYQNTSEGRRLYGTPSRDNPTFLIYKHFANNSEAAVKKTESTIIVLKADIARYQLLTEAETKSVSQTSTATAPSSYTNIKLELTKEKFLLEKLQEKLASKESTIQACNDGYKKIQNNTTLSSDKQNQVEENFNSLMSMYNSEKQQLKSEAQKTEAKIKQLETVLQQNHSPTSNGTTVLTR